MDNLGYLGSYTIALALYVIIFGLVGWVIGERKGRAGAGFLFGALLGPIGWIVILVGPDVKSAESAAQMRRCPFCAELIQPAAVVCKHCGRDIAPTWQKSRPVEDDVEKWAKEHGLDKDDVA